MALIVLIGAFSMPLLFYFLLPQHARKVYRQVKTMRHPTEVSWNHEGYSASTATSTSTIAWNDYFGWSADEKIVLLMQAPNLFQMLPRHALSGEQAGDLIGHIENSELRRI
ncbi:YcxB family protein [Aquamicrobium sp. LC103]|uniref:YcxB family protein n=1 Tax=Aquamicrobium sp. LC103 TaxID=1120658 RepID=UPI00109C4318|nr:YcxB family protein [Aquamicrobium sp. LC103]TKT78280.1 YcxB family protein [Aquamicrobium sp. LC103]